jgi:hypothetical protein
MAKTKPGWYEDGSGGNRYWDGAAWTEQYAPGPPDGNPQSPAGWYPFIDDVFGWWTGAYWGKARSTRAGDRVSIRDNLGQAFITVVAAGGLDAEAIAKLYEELRQWPPVRIHSFNTYTSHAFPATNLTCLVEWEPPD